MSTDEVDIEGYDPFLDEPACRHGDNPMDCVVACAVCKHTCSAHAYLSEACGVTECSCYRFEDDAVTR
jgi:hypothetical protein